MITFFIALKHIKERKRQSIFSTLGIAISITVLIVALAIANGLDSNMIQNMLSMSPHVMVMNDSMSIPNYIEERNKIEEIEGVKSAIPICSSQGIIKYEGVFGTFVSGILIEGMTEHDAVHRLKIGEKIVEGDLNFKKLSSIIIGKELYDQIGGEIGKKVKVVSSESKELYLEIVGVFQTGFYQYDSNMVIIPLKTAQILTEIGNKANSFDVRIENVYKDKEIAKAITSKTGLTSRTWSELNKNLLYALSLEKTVMVAIFSLFITIASFVVGVILNTLVREKTKDIGILRSIGFSRGRIMKIFMIEGLLLGLVGVVSGVIVSSTIIFCLDRFSIKLPLDVYYLEKLPVKISLLEILVIVFATVIVIFISSIFPAYRASKLTPVEALKYE